jgi:predicted MPP superfamily phosphohydrolase
MRTILIGDVHGCLEELKELVTQLSLSPSDCLVFVGDLLDKGPSPAETVRYVRQLGALMVLGNHEEKHLRWRKHEDTKRDKPNYKNPMQPLGDLKEAQNAALSDEDVAWLNSTRVKAKPFTATSPRKSRMAMSRPC